jgi:hypothetical protein
MMKHFRQVCLGLFLLLAFSIPAFAGDMQTPGVTGTIECGVAGQMPTGITGDIPGPGVTGDIGTPGIAGEMPNGITGDIECGFAGDLLILFLALLY